MTHSTVVSDDISVYPKKSEHGILTYVRNKLGGIREKLRSRRGDSYLVAVVIVICITIGLGYLYREQVKDLFVNTVFPGLQTAAQGFLNFTGA